MLSLLGLFHIAQPTLEIYGFHTANALPLAIFDERNTVAALFTQGRQIAASLFEVRRWAADSLASYVDDRFDTVRDLYERDTAVHSILFPVKGHGAFYLALSGALADGRERQLFGLRYSPDGKGARDIEAVWAGLLNLVGVEVDLRIVLHVEKIFAFQLAVHAASSVYTGSVDFDVQHTRREFSRGERKGGIPLVELAFYGYRGLDIKLHDTVDRCDFENRNVALS
jgi:hypothetical protein